MHIQCISVVNCLNPQSQFTDHASRAFKVKIIVSLNATSCSARESTYRPSGIECQIKKKMRPVSDFHCDRVNALSYLQHHQKGEQKGMWPEKQSPIISEYDESVTQLTSYCKKIRSSYFLTSLKQITLLISYDFTETITLVKTKQKIHLYQDLRISKTYKYDIPHYRNQKAAN